MRHRSHVRDDSGFSLIEVVVAMAVFAVLASITLGILLNTTDVAGDNIRRTAATNLVNSKLETARSLSAQAIPDGLDVDTETVNGLTYTVRQTASYVGSSSETSVCAGTGSSLAYKLVTVTVSWPNMGSIKPVRGDTLRAVGVGSDGLDATKGTLAISVIGALSQRTPDVSVTLTPGNIVRTTGDDGCAIYTGLTPGTYSASVNAAGYVGTANTQAALVSGLSATAGAVTRGSLLYDTERSVNVVFDGPVGAIVPGNLVVRAGNSYIPEVALPICTATATAACITAVPGATANLFPESYTIKAGNCSEGTPSQIGADLRPAGTNGTTVTVPVGAATVKVVRTGALTIGIPGRTITFSHAAPATGCTAADTFSTPSVAAGSTLLVPYGTWNVTAPVFNALGATVGTSTQVVTFSPTVKTATLTLEVAL